MKLFGYEITVKKIKRAARRKNKLGARRWTASEIQVALDLVAKGKDHEAIGAYLNRTRAAVAAKLHDVRPKQ